MKERRAFTGGNWTTAIDVRDFIQQNYTPYEGDETFLSGISTKTEKVWSKAEKMIQEEIEKGVLDIETSVFSGINNFKAGYLDKENESIVGFQTDAPLKRMMNPYGGVRMLESSLEAYGYEADGDLLEQFNAFRKSHNSGVFDAYTPDMRKARSVGLLTGLPDAYGRGRIIGDYRRIALYGIDRLIDEKKNDFNALNDQPAGEASIRLREEISEQVRALSEIKAMAAAYGYDISKPAESAQDAIQYFYFGYLAGVKESNGAAMSLGRNTAFLDVFIERDLEAGILTEEGAQELIDQLVIKLRMVRHLRTPEYDTLFAGDPTWVTEAIGGLGEDGRTLVTKTAYRFLHTLKNLDPAPEPNMTVLWSKDLQRHHLNATVRKCPLKQVQFNTKMTI